MKKIVAIHLLNDFSGSPLVLSQILQAQVEKGVAVDIFTAGNEGFLSNMSGAKKLTMRYSRSRNRYLTLISYFFSQLVLFFQLLKYRKSDAVFYINTLLPFGGAMAAWLMGKKLIYHVHETSIRPRLLKQFLKMIVSFTAHDVIYVSRYLQLQERIKGPVNHLIYNALSPRFISQVNNSEISPRATENFTAVMLCSLKAYKGVNEMVELAKITPEVQFLLVLNASQPEIDGYFYQALLPANLEILSSQKDVHPIYREASVVLNLSRTNEWVETFGMTILEGMYYRLPAIVPPVGGITELVEDGVNGFKIASDNISAISNKLKQMQTNQTFYRKLAENALAKTDDFSFFSQVRAIEKVLFQAEYCQKMNDMQKEERLYLMAES